jgi:hypothetical protein
MFETNIIRFSTTKSRNHCRSLAYPDPSISAWLAIHISTQEETIGDFHSRMQQLEETATDDLE